MTGISVDCFYIYIYLYSSSVSNYSGLSVTVGMKMSEPKERMVLSAQDKSRLVVETPKWAP